MDGALRLDKLLGLAGIARSEAKKRIAAGRVTVDGQVRRDPGFKARPEQVALDGAPLQAEAEIYLMLHKPAGVVTATEDKRLPTVVSLLPEKYARRKIGPVGRLDRDSEGLLLLTNDGALTHRLLHPSHEVSKEYRVTVSGSVEGAAERLRRVRDVAGLPIRPAEVRELSRKGNRAELSVIIHEGRNRQIRRMCAQCDLEVLRLQRVREHCLELGTLPLGQWRYLTAEEIAGLKKE